MSETENQNGDFTFPDIYACMPVEVSFDMNFSRPAAGMIHIPKQRSASVWVMTHDHGPVIVPHCRHKDDPWLKEHPTWLSENQGARAIFELSRIEMDRRQTKTMLESLFSLAAEQAKEIAALKAAAVNAGDIPRGPGRPRKHEPLEAVT